MTFPASGVPERLVRHRRRSLFLGAALIACTYAADLLLRHSDAVMLWRAAWTLAVLAAALLQRPGRPLGAFVGCQFAGVATGAAVVAIVAHTGGASSLYVGMLLATPFAVMTAVPDIPSAAVLSGVLCMAGGAAMRVADAQGAVSVAAWLVLSGLMVALSAWGAAASRRLWAAELGAERDRSRILEALADSERRRGEAERLAEVGRLAAQVAHEVNNPLAVVKSNVGWLREAEAGGGDAAERDQVVTETLESVDRISRIVSDLRRQARVRPAPPPDPDRPEQAPEGRGPGESPKEG